MSENRYLAAALKLRAAMDKAGSFLTDTQALEVQIIYAPWNFEATYAVGDRVMYNGVLYRCIIAHTAQEDWSPADAPSLWAKVLVDDTGKILPWAWNIGNPENRSWLRALMRSPDAPDAFYASNDKLAVELIHELNLLGLSVPGEVKVAGLENMDYLHDPLHPLTTAAYDNELLARTACELLRQMVDNPGERPASVKIPMTLLKRASTLSAACA